MFVVHFDLIVSFAILLAVLIGLPGLVSWLLVQDWELVVVAV